MLFLTLSFEEDYLFKAYGKDYYLLTQYPVQSFPGWFLFVGMLSCTENLTPLESPKRRLPALGMLCIIPAASLRGKASLLRVSQTTGSMIIPASPSCVPQWYSLGPPKSFWNGLSFLNCKIK